MNGFLLLRNIQVENANAVAGQTWGFPAITNFLGFTHALERKLAKHKQPDHQLKLVGCAVICHQMHTQTHQATPFSEHVFGLTRNPLTKDEKSPSFVEEGRVNMTVSLLIGVDDLDIEESELKVLEQYIRSRVEAQRLAGGTITQLTRARLVNLEEGSDDQKTQTNFWLRTLLPGFALVSRSDLLAENSQRLRDESPETPNPELTAWINNSTIHRNPDGSFKTKDYTGWVRPIPVGYKAISPLYQPGEVARCRDSETPVRFVEYAYSLGEWLSPHRIDNIKHLLWHYQTEPDDGWYLCQNDYSEHSI
jgi:CRISPR-associated protein Csy2